MVGTEMDAQEETTEDEITNEQRLAMIKDATLKIDPETAEVTSFYRNYFDPYGIEPDLPEELRQSQCYSEEYFARAPGSDVWVCFGDLPKKVLAALYTRPQGLDIADEIPF